MKSHEIEGIGISVYDQEYSGVELEGGKGCTLTSILREVGVVPMYSFDVSALDYENLPDEEGWKADAQEWREKEGRQYPRVYRMKIRVEAEELSTEEAEAYWKRRADENR